MSNIFSLIRSYLLETDTYWPATHKRNIDKLRRFLKSGANRHEAAHVRDIINLAMLRARFDPMHTYIVNMGSSGSHWVESMLGLLPGFYNGGEIYLPKIVRAQLATFSKEESNLFLDALYLAHTGRIEPDFLNAKLSNSAHMANHASVSQFSTHKKVILLLRNPIDVVISRTFRKDEYRLDVAPQLKDEDYLERNCMYVEKFVQNLDLSSFDLIVKYENFEADPLGGLKKLTEAIELDCSIDAMKESVRSASKESVAKAVLNGDKAINNVYLGEKREVAWARDYIGNRLLKACGVLGYA